MMKIPWKWVTGKLPDVITGVFIPLLISIIGLVVTLKVNEPKLAIHKFEINPSKVAIGSSVEVSWEVEECDYIKLNYLDSQKTYKFGIGNEKITMDSKVFHGDTIVEIFLVAIKGNDSTSANSHVTIIDTTVRELSGNRITRLNHLKNHHNQNKAPIPKRYLIRGYVKNMDGIGVDSVLVEVGDYIINTLTDDHGYFNLTFVKQKDEPWLTINLYPPGKYWSFSALKDTTEIKEVLEFRLKKK
jgi:hypothetical protein